MNLKQAWVKIDNLQFTISYIKIGDKHFLICLNKNLYNLMYVIKYKIQRKIKKIHSVTFCIFTALMLLSLQSLFNFDEKSHV